MIIFLLRHKRLAMFPQRKHIRLREFDYSSPNGYFITICVNNAEHALGTIKNGICGLSEIGNMAVLFLQKIPELKRDVILDEFIVMPNHLHCILILNHSKNDFTPNQFGTMVVDSVSSIINQFKGAVTRWCRQHRISFNWQGRFHDHVIRDNKEYWMIKNYIANNPRKWQEDRFHT